MDSNDFAQALESGDTEKVSNFLNSIKPGELGQTPEGEKSLILQVLEQASKNQQLAEVVQEKALKLASKNANGLSVLDHLVKTETGGQLIQEVIIKPLLLSQKGDVLTQLATSGWSDFTLPADVEAPEEAKRLISKLTDLRIKVTLVQAAIRDGRLEDVQSSLGEGGTVLEAAGMSGLPPLHQAVVYQNTDISRYIMTTFPQTLGFKDSMTRTALHYAAGCDDAGNLYQILKEAGADDTVVDTMGNTPVFYNENKDILQASEVKSTLEKLMKGQAGSRSSSRPASGDKTTTEDVESKPAESETAAAAAAQETEVPKTPPRPQTPPGPKVIKPVDMYVRRGGVNQEHAPPPSTVDGKYIAQHLGTALTLALAEIAEKRPWDPIEYLANWLYAHHKNEAYVNKQAEMLKTIREAEAKQNELEELKFKRKEEVRRLQEDDMRKQKEADDERKRQEMDELHRSNKEAALAQKPQLPTVKEDEEAEAEVEEADDDPNVRDRDIDGLTEMHKLASQEDVDLISLIDLGYSIADRDIKGRSVRDIAQETGRKDTVRTIDNYIIQLLADGVTSTLEKLVLEGYQDIENQASDNVPEVSRNFLLNIGNLKEQLNTAQKLSESGKEEELKEALKALPQLTQSKDQDGRSLLHRAVLAGHKANVDFLASQYPGLLHIRDSRNRTPLHYASGKSDELATLLVSKGAKQNAKDVYKRTAAFYKDHPINTEGLSRDPSSIPVISEPEPEASSQQPATTNETETSPAGAGESETGAGESEEVTPDASQLATTSVSQSEPQTSQEVQK